MSSQASGVFRWPWDRVRDGPLPVLLIALTVVSGVVDGVSYLGLGHVFVANMTGNVVFLGFALAGASGLSVSASLTALAAFLLGALIGGRVGSRLGGHRGRHLRGAAAVGLVPLLCASAVASGIGATVSSHERYALIALLAVAMGLQNATARRLAVPDLTTSVLTLTLTGVASDSRLAGRSGGPAARRLIAVAAMFAGALVGALLTLHGHIYIGLLIASAVVAACAVTAVRRGSADSEWARSHDAH
jgi:uncharacterized membrane protein YoaK (UPF0700 family)